MSVTTEYTVRHIRYDEAIIPGKRLGRHGRFDSRDAQYPSRGRRARVTVGDVEHLRHAPIFDQGIVGDCTGEMTTGALATSPLYEALPAGHPVLDDSLSQALYSDATALDGYPGQWPPTDTGSDGGSACKAARNRGFISGWLNAVSVDDVLQALMTGPVGLGFGWYDSFDAPGQGAILMIASGAGIRGGHETVWRKIDASRKLIGGDNSWGPGWGDGGSMWMSYATLERLLGEGGDCVVPQPATAPVPVPVPPAPGPVVDPALAAYLADARLGNWAAGRHVGENEYAARKYTGLRAHFGGV